jgi:hypothetical protein
MAKTKKKNPAAVALGRKGGKTAGEPHPRAAYSTCTKSSGGAVERQAHGEGGVSGASATSARTRGEVPELRRRPHVRQAEGAR